MCFRAHSRRIQQRKEPGSSIEYVAYKWLNLWLENTVAEDCDAVRTSFVNKNNYNVMQRVFGESALHPTMHRPSSLVFCNAKEI